MFDKINKSAQNLLNTFNSLNGAVSAFNGSKLNGVGSGVNNLSSNMRTLSDSVEGVTTNAQQATNALQGITLVKTAVFIRAFKQINSILTGITDTADELRTSLAVIDNYNFSDIGLDQLTQQLYNVSRATRTEFQQTASIVQDLLSTGLFRGENASINAIQTTEIINRAVIGSGQTGNSAVQAAERLTNALAQGQLTAANVTTILRNTPKLAGYIAEGFNELGYTLDATKENLRQLATDGELTADRVVRALHAASGTIQADFEAMPITFSQVRSAFGSTWQFVLTQLNQTDGPLQSINEQLLRISDWMSSSAAEPFWGGVALAVRGVGAALEFVIDRFSAFYNFVVDNSSFVIGVLTAMAVLIGVDIVTALALAAKRFVIMGLAAAAAHPYITGIAFAAGIGAFALAAMGVEGEDAFAAIGAAASATAFSVKSILVAIAGGIGVGVLTAASWIGDRVNDVKKIFDSWEVISTDFVGWFGALLMDAGSTLSNWLLELVYEFAIWATGLLTPLASFADTIASLFGQDLGLEGKVKGLQDNFSTKQKSLWEREGGENVRAWQDSLDDDLSNRLEDIWSSNQYNNPAEQALADWIAWFDDYFDKNGNIYDAIEDGANAGRELYDTIKDLINSIDLNGDTELLEQLLDSLDTLDLNDIDIGKVGEVGKINKDVDISQESIQLFRDIAQERYGRSLNDVQINIDATFGDINNGSDEQSILSDLASQLEEAVAAIYYPA